MDRKEVKKQFERVIAENLVGRLSLKKERILRMFYGVGYEKPMSLVEIAQHFDVTRERIRQLLAQGKRVVANIIQELEAERERKERMREMKAEGVEGLTVGDLGLSRRTYWCLVNANITHVSQLANLSEVEILRTKNFGRKSLDEIKGVLAQLGIRLRGSAMPIALNGTQQSDLDVVVAGIKKLSEEEAREVSLCLLNLLLPFTVNNREATDLLCQFRHKLLDS